MSETVEQKIAHALEIVAGLCDGSRRWAMNVPARPDSDPDLVIAGALRAAQEELRVWREAGALCVEVQNAYDEATGEHTSRFCAQLAPNGLTIVGDWHEGDTPFAAVKAAVDAYASGAPLPEAPDA